MPEAPDLPAGSLELLALQVLAAEATHGYEVARRIHLLSADALRVEEGSLYPALHRLERQKLLAASWGRSATNRKVRVYRLTAAGKRELQRRRATWALLRDAVDGVLGAGGAAPCGGGAS